MSEDRKPTVAVDLDGVLAKYDGWKGVEHIGDPIPGAREFLTSLRQFAKVLIYTTRTRVAEDGRGGHGAAYLESLVKEWLFKHDMPHDEVFTGQGKPLCAALIDDRAIPCRPQDFKEEHSMAEYLFALAKARRFCKGEK